jgi:hypothetical protein
MIYEAAMTNAFSSIADAENTNLYDFFDFMSYKRKQDEQIEKYINTKRTKK